MQRRNETGSVFEAPSPTIPTYRPSSQSSKRTYTLSALSPKYQQYLSMADDIHPLDRVQPDDENVTEIVHFLQTHVSPPAQTNGPKDMIKAGQRRLRLALRNKKGADSKAKAEEASRQLAALQQQNNFRRSQYNKWGNKQSVGSSASSSKSTTDLSYKSTSKRDVEGIGRPWLDHPFHRRDEPGSKGSSHVSSLDLRDLASFVEAAVNFSQSEDCEPPPYQPQYAAAASTIERMPHPNALPRSLAVASGPDVEDISRKTSDELFIAPRCNDSAQPSMSSERPNYETQPLGLKPKRSGPVAPKLAPPPSSRSSSAPTTPILKLFPDAATPRTSSRRDLRIPTSRSSTPKPPLPPVSTSQNTPLLPSVFESNNRELRNSSKSLPKIHEHASDAHGTKRPCPTASEQPSAIARERLDPADAEAKQARRPSSLPPGIMDAFPMPAPAKPLPTVPEPNSRLHGSSEQSALSKQKSKLDLSHHIAELPGSLPPGISISSPSSPDINNSASRGRDSPFPRIVGTVDASTRETKPPASPRRGSQGKAGRTREAKVRSLIMRDLAKSRHLKNLNKGQIDESQKEAGSAQTRRNEDSQFKAQEQCQKMVLPGPSSPPLKAPQPSNPSRQVIQNRRYCTPLATTMAAALESHENQRSSTSNRKHHVSRRSSALNLEAKSAREPVKQSILDQEETPLPSSDDEGPAGDFYWNPPRKSTGRRRRKPTPIIVDKPATERGRSMEKQQTTNSMSPTTLHNYSRRGLAKKPQTHPSTKDHQTYERHNYHTPDPKPNSSLEGRVEHLERQNKILQAALLAALDVGVKQDLSSLLVATAASNVTPPLTGTSFSSGANTVSSEASSAGQERHPRNGKAPYQPESWIASPDSFKKDNYGSDDVEAREIEQMIDEFDLDWLSDRSSILTRG
ncbi:uncharacterized protein DSM5745_07821 [Aspergillus mulundensis]|uniref:Uncharacterized protein n=1 Tax=Aspergillus mulundensis TaxID=1810919 RepID=A0A3D8RF24_9EURO|nr:Uncharacterized protein DSM5745_07821 [Aspergillus mulundensis]RDW72649.1 Uncharacterized protein DSM5745_07821 [Aspergillus mulundensis]